MSKGAQRASSLAARSMVSGLWLAACSLWAACAHQGHHEHAHVPHEHGTIQVGGVGEARGAPDVARSSIGVEARASSVQDALRQANAQITQIIQALKGQGIADADLQTHGFSVAYERDYVQPVQPSAAPAAAAPAPGAPAPAVRGAMKKSATVEAAPVVAETPAPAPNPRGAYVVTNQLQVTVRDVAKLGDVLTAATTAGANNIWGISFDLADKTPLVEKARAKAIENAKRDAERVASLSGVKLGKLLRVNDGASGGGGPVPMMRAYAAEAVPVERGELTVDHQVSLEYAIAE
ncbi:MAG TPA: SIMPL domain-containing protein [Polyangiales bacterium]